MLATVRAALDEADRRSGRTPTPSRVAQAAIASGALMGARGNSGVITSQILGGMAARARGQAPLQRPRPRARPRRRARRRPTAVAAPGRGHDPDGHPRGLGRRRRRRRARQQRREACSPPPSRPPRSRSPRRRPCCRSCARRTSWTPAARASSACSRARSRRRAAAPVADGGHAAGARAAAGAATPVRARRRRRDGVRLRDRLPRARAPGRAAGRARRSRRTSSPSATPCWSPATSAMAKIHVHNERPDAVIAYGLSLGTLIADHHREPRRPGQRRPRGEGGGLRRRGRRRVGATGGLRATAHGRTCRRCRVADGGRRRCRPRGCRWASWRSRRRTGWRAILDDDRRGLPGVRRLPRRPRRPEREPVHRRAARGGRRRPRPTSS